MADTPEEVKRLVEAIQAFDAIEDDAACVEAVSRALKDWPDHHKRMRELRQRRVLALREQKKTWPEIAKLMGGITAARAQQIGAGLSGAERKRRKKSDEEAAD